MVLEEVDSGRGGATAEIVGQKLRALGESRQVLCVTHLPRSEEHTSELQSLMRISYAVFCLKKKTQPRARAPGRYSARTENTSTDTPYQSPCAQSAPPRPGRSIQKQESK